MGDCCESELESGQTVRTALVEANGFRAAQEWETDRTDATIELGHHRIVGDEFRNALDRRLEERKMILAEGAGRKIDIDAGNGFDDCGFARESKHFRAENRIASLGLGVEEESLQPIPQAPLDRFWQIAEDVRRLTASDEHDLNPLGRPFYDELQISKRPAMRSIGVGFDSGFTNRLADLSRRMVDRGVMDRAVGRMHDAMATALEEADLGVSGLAANGEARAMSMAEPAGRMDRWFGESGVDGDGAELRPDFFWELAFPETGASRAGRAMRAVDLIGHP